MPSTAGTRWLIQPTRSGSFRWLVAVVALPLLVPFTASGEVLSQCIQLDLVQSPATTAICSLAEVVGLSFNSFSTDVMRLLKRSSKASRLRLALPPIHHEHLPVFGSQTGTAQNRMWTT